MSRSFTIRELMIATAVVAIAAAWWSDHFLLRRQIIATYDRGKQLSSELLALEGRNIGDGGMYELPRWVVLNLGFDLWIPFSPNSRIGADMDEIRQLSR